MFANRYSALLDACVLVPVLKRNFLLSLAAAYFFRPAWSADVLDETHRALAKRFAEPMNDMVMAEAEAEKQVERMRIAFPEAMTVRVKIAPADPRKFPDVGDVHVLEAALAAHASVIVTDNLKDFPKDFLATYHLEARSADDFIADTVSLDEGRAVKAIKLMRERFKKPALTAARLILSHEEAGLFETAEILRPYEGVL